MTNTHSTLSALFVDIADAIRAKKGGTDTITADNFPVEIEDLKTGFDYNNQNVTSISDYEFYNCEDLNNVDCYNLQSVGASAFEGCSNLKTVILYDGVTNIGENAFKGCSEDLTIYCMFDSKPEAWHENWNPDNCEVIWNGAIETWDISATEEDNVTAKLYNDIKNESYYILFISGNGNMKNYLSSSAVSWCNYRSNIKSITILNSVTNIGKYAFNGCTNLTSVIIPNSITSIGGNAFYDCDSLASVIIPNNITSIGDHAFQFCNSLASITIPNSVTSVGNWAINSCPSLISITYTGTIAQWKTISFGKYWDYGTDNYTVHCTDGDIAKS